MSSHSSSSSSLNLEDKATMDLVQQSEHLCYVRCNFCNTVLAVGIPCKRLLDTVTVKCGHCGNLSFLSTRPPLPVQGQCFEHQPTIQTFFSDLKKGQSSSSSSSTSGEPSSPKAPFVVKPPEKKHRLPSAYNRFMKEEIQRIKAANPEIPHREAFSAAAKNVHSYRTNRVHCREQQKQPCLEVAATAMAWDLFEDWMIGGPSRTGQWMQCKKGV